ncbi:type II toxin-antitoxin system VapC family toxin [Geminisphaera colitermitum]|uniref:type II toxin-antitoxin system VapC family toxin n=1 Tax=Geminisphaera colitermitum TaxID=1148786 RepID=UPI000158D192|nr:type II toxin-antitoxin system VapC family toxin [Geminisphaera colitermitum]
MLFDNEFLISMSKGDGSKKREQAAAFLATHPGVNRYTSRICWAEFAEGCGTRETVDEKLARFVVLGIDEEVAWNASRISRQLKRQGLHIGDNDIWIAATALVYDLTLVSNNAKHFSRIPGLKIIGY